MCDLRSLYLFTYICERSDQTRVHMTRLVALFECHIQPLMEAFGEWGCAASPTLQYWDMFLSAVEIMFTNVRTDRDGKWSMHLRTSSNMLPHFFVANHINYSIWIYA